MEAFYNDMRKNMKVQFLGTAAAEGFPALFCQCETCRKAKLAGGKNRRGRSGCVLNDTVMIDFPPDIYALSQQLSIDLSMLTDVFITHSHGDHFTPAELLMRMPGCYAILDEKTGPLRLHGNEETHRVFIQAAERELKRKEVNFIEFIKLDYFKPVSASGGLTLTHLPAHHKPDEKAGIFFAEEKQEGAFLYGHDTGWFPEETWKYLEGRKLSGVSLDCTCGRYRDEAYHMGFPNVLEAFERLKEQGCITEKTLRIVNHFSHNGHATYDEMCELARPHGILVSYDGMTVQV